MQRFLFLICMLLTALKGVGQSQSPPSRTGLQDTILLKEVIVSATVPLDNRHIEHFYKTNYFSTIDKITARLEGVSLIKRGAYALEPQLNGFSGGQLNITIDGMKIFGACTDKMDPVTSYLEPANLKSITVLHGSEGNVFGNTVGGAIDLALQEPAAQTGKPFYSTISAGFETVSSGRTLLWTAGSVRKKWHIGFNGVLRKNECYRDGKGERVPFSQFEKSNWHGVAKFLPDSNNTLRLDLLYDRATNVGYPALPMDVGSADAFLAGLEFQRVSRLNLKAKIYYNTVNHVMDDSHRDSIFWLTTAATGQRQPVIMRMDMPGKSETFGSYWQTAMRFNPRNRLTLKLDNYINHSLAEMTMHMHYPGQAPEPPMYLQTWPRMMRSVTGIYLEERSFLSPKLVITTSGRVDWGVDQLESAIGKEQLSVFSGKVAGRYITWTGGMNFSAQYHVRKSVLLNGEAGYSQRLPTITERFGFYLYNAYDGYDYIGNPSIRPERSWFARMGVAYSGPQLKINFFQSASWVKDYIIGLTEPTVPSMNFYAKGTRVYQNLSGARFYSTDLQISASPLSQLSLMMLTKYTAGRMNSGDFLPLMAPLCNVVSVAWQPTSWSFSLENQSALRQHQINVQYGERPTPGFTLFSLKAGRHFMWKHTMLDCSVAVTNLLNARYWEHLDWGRIYRPGRSLELFVKVSL